MTSPSLRRKTWWAAVNVPLWAAALATLLTAGLYLGHAQGLWLIPGLADLELSSIDARFRLRGPRQPKSDDVIIVGLDDRTRQDHGEVFQSRRGWSKLITALARYQPRAIGLDVLFSDPEVTLPPEVLDQARAALAELDHAPTLPPAAQRARAALAAVIAETHGDQELAQSVAGAGSVLLGVVLHLASAHDPTPPPPALPEPHDVALARYGEWVASPGATAIRPPQAVSVSRSLSAIAAGAAGAGTVNVLADQDGNIRRLYGVIEHHGRYYMPLGLSVALARLDTDASYVAGQRHIRVGSRPLPTSARGELSLAFLGPARTFPQVSAADVLDGAVPAEVLRDRLVLVGYTDVARDKLPTPFDAQLDGVELHATLVHNVLHGELLRRTGPVTTLLTMLLLGAAVTLLQLRRVRRRRAWMAGALALIFIAAYVMVAAVLFSEHAVQVEVAAPVMGTVTITLASLVASLATEGREKAHLRAAFSQYVSDAVVDRLLADPGRARLGGERRELTVLFADIRGFASLSEQLEPEELSEFLNEYLTPMTGLVMDQGGMLDKYIGDAVMAVYGAPIEMDNHAERACRTALAMLALLGPLNQRWRSRGLPEIAIGIGLNSGPMAVGNMGSETRFDYTVLGDAVNLGARLEGLTKEYRTPVLVGEETARQASRAFVFRELDWVRVKGRSGTARIYELMSLRDKKAISAEDLGLYSQALAAYRSRDWDAAERELGRFAERFPQDGPAQVMLARVHALRAAPPPADWDGAFEQQSK